MPLMTFITVSEAELSILLRQSKKQSKEDDSQHIALRGCFEDINGDEFN